MTKIFIHVNGDVPNIGDAVIRRLSLSWVRSDEPVVAYAADAIGPDDACGAYPLRGLLEIARERTLVPSLLDLRSSGDTGGTADRVVGYGAFALADSPQ